MAVPSSGQISLNDINIAAGKPSESEANFGELGLGAGFLDVSLGMNKFYGWFPNLIMLGSYLTAQSPAYSNDCGRNWTELDMSGWSPFRMMGVGFYDAHGFGTRNGETYAFSGQTNSAVTGTGTRRTFVSRDHGCTWEYTDVSANAYTNIFPDSSSGNLSFIGTGYAWDNNKGRSTDGEQTWTTVTNTTVMAPYLCCSSSGQYIIGGMHNGWVKRSSDYGSSWTEQLSTTGVITVPACDDSGQYVIGWRAASGGRFSLSTNYGATWANVSGVSQWCCGYISPDSNFIVYTNATDQTLNYSTSQGGGGSPWTSIDISTEFPTTDETIYCYGCGSNTRVWLYLYNNASYTKVYSYTKGDGGISEVFDYSSVLNGKAIQKIIPSKFYPDGQQILLMRDTSGNLFHIPDALGTPVVTKIWDADIKEGDQTQFYTLH